MFGIVAIDRTGTELYYTGRTGAGWVTPNIDEAFPYVETVAKAKAERHNKWTEIHGLHFVPVPLD